MPAQIKQMLLRDEYQLHPAIRGTGPRSHHMTSIAVQPPSRASTAQTLYPPVIARQSTQVEPGAQHFATAVLLNEGGAVVDGCLEGTKAAAGFQLDELSGSSTMIYAFSNLSISNPGSYSIRLDLYKMSADSSAGATLVEQLEANATTVYNGDVPRQQPSPHERALMNRARDAGVPLPSPK